MVGCLRRKVLARVPHPRDARAVKKNARDFGRILKKASPKMFQNPLKVVPILGTQNDTRMVTWFPSQSVSTMTIVLLRARVGGKLALLLLDFEKGDAKKVPRAIEKCSYFGDHKWYQNDGLFPSRSVGTRTPALRRARREPARHRIPKRAPNLAPTPPPTPPPRCEPTRKPWHAW